MTLLISGAAFSQIKFENGHYVDNNGIRHEVQIRNMDWNDNPRKISVRDSDQAQVFEKTIDEIREFTIPGAHKFVRVDVDMDRSESNSDKRLSADKNPIFVNERLFLRTLIDGDYKLFIYEESGFMRMFYQTPQKPVSQLVYKRYHPSYAQTNNPRANSNETDFTVIYDNNQFRNQLWNDAKCPDTKLSDVERLRYTKSSLTDYMIKVNKCLSSEQSMSESIAPAKKGKLNFGPVAGVGFLKFSSQRIPSYWSVEQSATSLQIGVELEYVLPTNANKLALFMDPHYVNFKGGTFGYDKPGPTPGVAEISFSNFSLPLGVRYYFHLSSSSRIFLDGAGSINMVTNGKWEYDNSSATPTLPDGTNFGFVFGTGFNYKRYSIAARLYTATTLHPSVNSDFTRTAITLKYFIL